MRPDVEPLARRLPKPRWSVLAIYAIPGENQKPAHRHTTRMYTHIELLRFPAGRNLNRVNEPSAREATTKDSPMPELTTGQSVLLTDLAALCINRYRLFTPGIYVCVHVPVEFDDGTRGWCRGSCRW